MRQVVIDTNFDSNYHCRNSKLYKCKCGCDNIELEDKFCSNCGDKIKFTTSWQIGAEFSAFGKCFIVRDFFHAEDEDYKWYAEYIHSCNVYDSHSANKFPAVIVESDDKLYMINGINAELIDWYNNDN